MLNNKRRSIKIFTLTLFGLFLLSSVFTGNGYIPNQSSSKESSELIEPEENFEEEPIITSNLSNENEEYIPPAYDRDSIKWFPIEESLSGIQPEAESGGDSISTSTYDVIGGLEGVIPYQATPMPETMPELSVVEPYAGLLSGGDTIESIIGSDDLTLRTDNEVFPWRSVTKLYISASDGSNWVGSGMIIDNFHVLTAGHCVYLHDHGGWASSIEILPGMDLDGPDPTDPYGHAWATLFRSYTGWTVDESANHDWAMLTLDRNVGYYTGWMGRTTAGSSSTIYTDTMNVAGYPSESGYTGRRMYWDTDPGYSANDYRHWYTADTLGGMSGGPVWRYVSGSRYIMTIHAYGGTTANSGTRLNSDKYNRIFDWLAADTAPTDRPDLTDRGSAYHSLSSYSVTAGVSSFTISHQIRNKGTASSGGFYVYYYASTNNYISTSDYYIGYDYVSSIAAFSTASAGWTGTFPNIPGGSYYIGWIIDRDNLITEFDEDNNVAYVTPTVSVAGLNPPISYIEVRVRDSVTSSYLQSAYVKTYIHGTSTLVDTGYTDSNGFYNITNLAVGTYDVIVSKNGYQTQTKTDIIDNLMKGYDDDYLYYYLVPYGPLTSWIEVTVKDSVTANPISSAYVTVTNMSSGSIIKTGYTSGTGFYNITGLSIGWYEVTVSRTSYKPQTKQNYINWNHDDDYLTFNLVQFPPDSGYIEVRVYNETGGPKSGAYIECVNDTSGSLIRTGYTDANGFYNVTGLTIGWYTINSSYVGYYEQSKSNYINWYGDDDYLTFYLMAMPPDSGFIEVSVYDSITYSPLYLATVTVTNQTSGLVIQTGYTDSYGFYKIANLTIGWYTVEISKNGYYTQSKTDYINWAGDDDYLYFYLVQKPPDSGYIEVIVRDKDTMAPIQNALVTCNYQNGTYFKSGYTDSSGFYNITGLYIGWYDIVVTHTNYGGGTQSDYINWNGDDDYLYFYLELKPPGWIEVRVFDIYNTYPIVDAYVRCFNTTSGELFDEGYTDSSGFYNITGLEIGWWTVDISHPAFNMQSQDDYINWRGDDDYLYFYLEPKFIPIVGPIAIFRDKLPWNLNMTEPILQAYNIQYIVYSSLDFGTVDLSSYRKVIIVSDQYQSFYNRLAGNVSYFESYVSNGGTLEFHACDRGWGGGNWDAYTMPGNLTKSWLYLQNVSINLGSHPVLLTPSFIEDDELDNWLYSAHGYFTNYPIGTKEILLYPITSDPVLIEFPLGLGYIIASMQTLEWNHNLNYTRLLENIILYNPGNYYEPIDVISPDSTSVWEVGSAYSITWTAPPSISDVKIDLYENGVFVMELAATTPNDGEFSWTVPIGLSDSVNYQIKITDPLYPANFDFSDNFEIVDLRSITVVSPDSDSSWVTGNTYDINWTSTGPIANVMIQLYASGILIMDIVTSTSNDGTYSWIIPDMLINYTEYVIRISDVLDPTIYDDSEPFTITTPPGAHGIFGYDILILLSLIFGVSITLIKKGKRKIFHKS